MHRADRRIKILALSVLFLLVFGFPGEAKTRRLVLYHTNDIHGYISAREAAFYKENPKRLIGGFAALASLVRRESEPYLLLDSGDLFFASPEGDLTNGESVVALANALGYAASALGNHEFDRGEKRLGEIAKKLKFPFLGANILRKINPSSPKTASVQDQPLAEASPLQSAVPPSTASGGTASDKPASDKPEYFEPYTIREVGGIKVGIIGLITPSTPIVTLPKNVRRLKFLRPVNVAKNLVGELRAKGSELIIVLSHIGFAKDGEEFEDEKYLASQVPGIDVILGGHSHTRIEKAFEDAGNKTIIIQSGSYLTAVGKLELWIGDDGKITKFKHHLMDLWVDEVGEDSQILGIMKPYKDKVDRKLSEVIGKTEEELRPNREGESALGNFVTDCMRGAVGAEVGMQNSGGIRSAIPAGEVTLRHLYLALPFDNTIVTMELTGSQLKDILEISLSDAKSRMQVSGLKLRYDPNRPKGHRLSEVLVAGKSLMITKNYVVATNNFLADGGDGYNTFLNGQERKDSKVPVRDAAIACVKKQSPLRPRIEGRLRPE